MRFNKQRGFLPSILYVTGLLVHLAIIGGTSPFLFSTISAITSDEFNSHKAISIVQLIIGMIGLVWSIPLIIGSFFVSVFPDMRVTEDGIEYCVYGIFRSRLKWNEINSVLQLPRGYRAIAISRAGSTLFNGLYTNKIFGDIVKSNLPVVLISPHLENIDFLLREINNHLNTSSTAS